MPLLLDTPSAPAAGDDAEQVDPRIRARRARVALEQQHRRRRWVAGVLVAATVLIGAWFVTRTALLDIDQVRVVGSVHTTDDEIRAVSGLEVGSPILDLDAGAVRSRLLTLPWVADAKVDRSWDGDVVVRVTERRPIAMISDGQGRSMLVDAEGVVVAPADLPDPNLLAVGGLVAGPPGDRVADSEGPLAVVSALTPGLRTRVEEVVMAPDGGLQLHVRPSGVVDFCGPTAIADKVRSLQTVFAQVDDTGLTSLSVCVPDQPTIGPRS